MPGGTAGSWFEDDGSGELSAYGKHEAKLIDESEMARRPKPCTTCGDKDKDKKKETKKSDLEGIKTPADAPEKLTFSPENQKQFDAEMGKSYPGGKSMEQGGTLVAGKDGTITMQNVGGTGSTAGSFNPDLTTKNPGDSVVGVFHTHPYDSTEGGFTGVSLSGGDAGYVINNKQDIIIAQSGTDQFAYVRTDATPASVNYTALNNSQNARIGALVKGGMDFPAASQQAAMETAQANNLAYYQGSGGTMTRVWPK